MEIASLWVFTRKDEFFLLNFIFNRRTHLQINYLTLVGVLKDNLLFKCIFTLPMDDVNINLRIQSQNCNRYLVDNRHVLSLQGQMKNLETLFSFPDQARC